MAKLLRILATSALLVGVPVTALAQSAINGVVRDSSGAVLPGVTVEAASEALIERVRTAITDDQGLYRLLDLRPGTYTLTFSLPGFNNFKREGLQLAAEFTATINAELSVGALEETVTVTGESPVVDITSAARSQVLDREAIDSIPTGRSIQGMAQLVPGVSLNLPDTGGARAMQQTYMTVRGMTTANTTMLVDGMLVNGLQADGAVQSYFNDAMNQEVSIQTSGISVDDAHLRRGRVGEHRDLLARIGDRVHRILAAVQPQDRAEHVVQARVQTISVAQVDSTDQNALAAGITGVVGPICLEPEGMLLGRDGVAEAGLQQLGHVVVGDHPIVADRGEELVDGRRDEFITVPATEITAALAFVIHRGAQDDDAFHLVRGQHRHPGGDPAALRGAEHESLRNSENLEYLQVGDGAVPVGELLPCRACGAVPVGLDGQHIHGGDECGIRELGTIQLHRRGERVDHDKRRKRRVVRFAELVADRRAAQVRNGDGFGLAGHSSLLSFSDVGCVAIAALGKN